MRAIIVFYDTLNRRYLETYGCDDMIETPNFKRLAQKSVQFNNAFVGSMPCIPARRELHTGRHNFLHREWGPIEPFDDSMPEILKKNGIYTHLVSDHLHYWEDGGATYHNRYSSWEIVRGQEGDHWKGQVKDPFIPECVMVPQANDGSGNSSLWRYDWVNRQYIIEDDDYPQNQTFKLGLEFIEKNKNDDNWLLQIETFDPHEPFYAPDEYNNKFVNKNYKGKHFDWPRGKCEQTAEEIEHARNMYRALLTMCDYNLGKVLDIMDKYNMWEDTLLIVGTDHGFSLGEHGYWGKNIMPYYNTVAHIPLYIYDPISKIINESRNQLVQMIDWAPTILNFFNILVPKDMQGGNILNVIRKNDKIRNEAIFGTFSGHINITDGKYVYMKSADIDLKDEIYNYTLLPLHMHKFFTIDELENMELVDGFDFTKGVKLLKIKSKEKYDVAKFGDLFFDIEKDYEQENSYVDDEKIKYFKEKIIEKMKENDAPNEQYKRYGLDSI